MEEGPPSPLWRAAIALGGGAVLVVGLAVGLGIAMTLAPGGASPLATPAPSATPVAADTATAGPNTTFATPATAVPRTPAQNPGDGTAVQRNETTTAQPLSPTATPGISFDVDLTSVERCGRTCRETTATVTNTGDRTTVNTTLNVRVYADSVDGDPVYIFREPLGNLTSGASVTRPVRLNFAFREAVTLCQADTVVFLAIITADEGQDTFQTTTEPDCQ
jgi:hypothetical protein